MHTNKRFCLIHDLYLSIYCVVFKTMNFITRLRKQICHLFLIGDCSVLNFSSADKYFTKWFLSLVRAEKVSTQLIYQLWIIIPYICSMAWQQKLPYFNNI